MRYTHKNINLEKLARCDQETVRLALRSLYDEHDKKLHVQREIEDIRYTQGVCYILDKLIKLTQPTHG